MRRIVLICSVCLCALTSFIAFANKNNGTKKEATKSKNVVKATAAEIAAMTTRVVDSIYNQLNLAAAGLQKNVFAQAYKGYQYLLSQGKLRRTDVMTIVDYSKSSSEKRMYVVDMENGELLYNTYVSHGKNSGAEYATRFSNRVNSNATSLGFMLTAETYVGSKGYSLRLDGVEPGINDNVRKRAVVIHGSDYVNPERAAGGVMMGRSFGCPAVSYREHKEIIDEIKNGSLFYAYHPEDSYVSQSRIINARFDWPVILAMNVMPAEQTDSKGFPALIPTL